VTWIPTVVPSCAAVFSAVAIIWPSGARTVKVTGPSIVASSGSRIFARPSALGAVDSARGVTTSSPEPASGERALKVATIE
jgi:hypothetical protein